jgi:hypothetical protein
MFRTIESAMAIGTFSSILVAIALVVLAFVPEQDPHRSQPAVAHATPAASPVRSRPPTDSQPGRLFRYRIPWTL